MKDEQFSSTRVNDNRNGFTEKNTNRHIDNFSKIK